MDEVLQAWSAHGLVDDHSGKHRTTVVGLVCGLSYISILKAKSFNNSAESYHRGDIWCSLRILRVSRQNLYCLLQDLVGRVGMLQCRNK